MPTKRRRTRNGRAGRSTNQRIEDLRRRIRDLQVAEAAKAMQKEAVFRHLKATKLTLEKAVGHMDGRSGKLEPEFIRASRQYLNLLIRALEEITGRRRRGRKPRMDFAS